jgi:5-methylcytosine-specific restriction endonuclease McrA
MRQPQRWFGGCGLRAGHVQRAAPWPTLLGARKLPRHSMASAAVAVDRTLHSQTSAARTASRLLALPVLVLNRSWVAVHVTNLRRAICLVYRDDARVVAPDTLQTHGFDDWVCLIDPPTSRWISAPRIAIPVPEVIHLTRYDRIPAYEAPFTRRNLYQRDNFTCQYCGTRLPADRLSIDHVQPKSKGGKTTWDNCVLACVGCNTRKADRTLQDSTLRLIRQPRRPRWTPYLTIGRDRQMPSWQRFLTPRQLEIGT